MRGMVVGWYIHLWGNQCKKNKECFFILNIQWEFTVDFSLNVYYDNVGSGFPGI